LAPPGKMFGKSTEASLKKILLTPMPGFEAISVGIILNSKRKFFPFCYAKILK